MKNIVDFLKLPPRILGALSVASGLLLFLPTVIIEKLYMTSFRDKYGFAICCLPRKTQKVGNDGISRN